MSEATYELRFRGLVARSTLCTFEEMDMRTDTIISGTVTDEAALRGLLERIGGLGYEILEVHQVCETRDDRRSTSADQADRPNTQGDN